MGDVFFDLRNDCDRVGRDVGDPASGAFRGGDAGGAVVELDWRTAWGVDCFVRGGADAKAGGGGVYCRGGGRATGFFGADGSLRVAKFAAANDQFKPGNWGDFGVRGGAFGNATSVGCASKGLRLRQLCKFLIFKNKQRAKRA